MPRHDLHPPSRQVRERRVPAWLPCALACALAPFLARWCAAEDSPAATGWMAAVDARGLISGRVGAWISRLAQDEHIHARLSLARASTGVDLLHDLDSVCAVGADAEPGGALARIAGRFALDRLETLALAAPGGTCVPVGAGQLMMVPHPPPAFDLVAVLDQSGTHLLLGTERARVLAAVADPPQLDATRFGAVLEHDATATPLAWFAAAHFDAWRSLPASAEPLRAVAAAQILIEEAGGMLRLRAALLATSAEAAQRYASILGGLCDLASMEPHVRLDPALEAALESKRIELHGARVDLTAALAIDLAERTWTPKILESAR